MPEQVIDEELKTEWQEINQIPTIIDHPIRPPAITLRNMSPYELFYVTFGSKLLDLLTRQTNRYAYLTFASEETQAYLERYTGSRLHQWTETTIEEMRKYLAIILSFALSGKSNIKDSWKSLPLFPSLVSHVLPLKRFQLLEHFLQINAEKTNQWKSMHNIGPLLKLLAEFNQTYTPSSKIALDELIAPFRGRFRYLTYNPQKPQRWGIRVIAVADALNGFCLSLIPQFGAETYEVLDVPDMDGLILRVIERHSQPGMCLYIDNYYCHNNLIEQLLSKGINVTGTFRQTRTDVPILIKQAEVKKWQ